MSGYISTGVQIRAVRRRDASRRVEPLLGEQRRGPGAEEGAEGAEGAEGEGGDARAVQLRELDADAVGVGVGGGAVVVARLGGGVVAALVAATTGGHSERRDRGHRDGCEPPCAPPRPCCWQGLVAPTWKVMTSGRSGLLAQRRTTRTDIPSSLA